VTLSGGQKQRVSIARTLLLDPKILVFDDSTSSVDTQTEYDIQQALTELMKGRTTFVIAQRLRTVRSAHQILVLKDGQIVERGRHEELIAQDGLYRQIYDLELRDQEEAFERERQRVAAMGLDPVEEESVAAAGGANYWGTGGAVAGRAAGAARGVGEGPGATGRTTCARTPCSAASTAGTTTSWARSTTTASSCGSAST
jgi:ABC-type multidrug transport system ATPase subunit